MRRTPPAPCDGTCRSSDGLLGGPDTVGSGNVVQLRLPEGSIIDVHVLMGGTSREAVELPGLGRELLEGMDIDASPGFSAWLLG